MGSSKEHFEQKLTFGEEGEKEVAIKLIKKGCKVLPLYQFTAEFAPEIISDYKNFISPDLTVFKSGNTFFVEVKSKNQWVEYKGVRETGCNYRHYKEYKDLHESTGIDLYMVFNHLEKDPKGMYLVNIETSGRYWDGKVNKVYISPAMFFWNYKDLIKI